MSANLKELPRNFEQLGRIIADQQADIDAKRVHINRLEEQIALLKNKVHGSSSEKLKRKNKNKDDEPVQEWLFNEAEAHAVGESEPESKPEPEEEIIRIVKKRKGEKPGRKPIPDDYPCKDVLIDLPEEEKTCKCGETLTCIGEDISKRAHVVPQQIVVHRFIRPKYACRKCEGTADESSPAVKKAPSPHLLPKSIATAGFLAWIFTAKFCDALPFYRLEKIFRRIGFKIGRATMCNQTINVAKRCERIRELMWDELLKSPLLHIDETTVQVLKEPGRSPRTKSYMFVFHGWVNGQQIVIFEYRTSRSCEFLKERLKNYRGVVMTDGFSGYNWLDEHPGIVHVVCWAHARRKFNEAKIACKSPAADQMLAIIKRLYAVETEARVRNLAPAKIKELRRAKSAPIIREIREWLKKHRNEFAPKTAMGVAVGYIIKFWKKLLKFLKDGVIPLDNNLVENDIRPFVIGRKNWLFSVSQAGAHASAFIYSLIQTALANGHEPYWYLRFLFELFPAAHDDDDQIKELLPYNVQPDEIREFFNLNAKVS